MKHSDGDRTDSKVALTNIVAFFLAFPPLSQRNATQFGSFPLLERNQGEISERDWPNEGTRIKRCHFTFSGEGT